VACSFVQAGATLDTRNDDGCTAMLECAASSEEGHCQSGRTALILASVAGHRQAVECLLMGRAILAACSGCGETPLLMAAADRWDVVPPPIDGTLYGSLQSGAPTWKRCAKMVVPRGFSPQRLGT